MIKPLEGVFRPGGLKITEALLEVCAFGEGARVLDLGCGEGRTVAHLTEKHGLDAVGVDRDAARVARAKRHRLELNVHRADGASLPFPDAVFDGVFAECTLSVMNYAPAVLGEIHRVLRPGGKLAVSDLYIRAGFSGDGDRPAAACFKGARTHTGLQGLLARHGFQLIIWQDVSGSLKEFVARYIMAYGSLDSAWQMRDRGRPTARCKRAFGYFFMVAAKSLE